MKFIIVSIFLFGSSVLFGQDSTVYFPYGKFIKIVKENHPVAYQAELTARQGDLFVQQARGAFDPKLKAGIKEKYFEKKKYYSYLNAGLVIPTWFGAKIKGGYDNNDGVFLSNESFTNPEGLWNAGIDITLGKGLFIDQRRADIKQAKFMQSSTLLEQQLVLNQLQFDAALAYFEWQKAFNKKAVYEESVENALIRLKGVRQSVINGDKPAVDTLKAAIQWQDRKLKLEQADVALRNKKVWLNTFLWQDGFIPLELDTLVQPLINDSNFAYSPMVNIEPLVNNHPEVLMYNNDIEITRVDYRLKRESLKPTLDLNYYALTSNSSYNVEDYKWGAKFSYPIFTRKERAAVRLYGIKLDQKNTGLTAKKAQIKYKIFSSFNQLTSSNDQVSIQETSTSMYRDLFNSELTLFNIGESSLFMVNIREQNLIESQVKLIDVIYKNQEANAFYKYHTFGFD